MIRKPVVRQFIILIVLFVAMSGTYFSREPRLGFGDAGFWQIFAMGMLTGAVIVNVVILLRNRK
ncbi:MAG: hypothetical protein JXA62_04065 [Candidatus Aminicenantes bacterium]|nr:hypothetical protein [Candidatus Aminicenantes bacterium]